MDERFFRPTAARTWTGGTREHEGTASANEPRCDSGRHSVLRDSGNDRDELSAGYLPNGPAGATEVNTLTRALSCLVRTEMGLRSVGNDDAGTAHVWRCLRHRRTAGKISRFHCGGRNCTQRKSCAAQDARRVAASDARAQRTHPHSQPPPSAQRLAAHLRPRAETTMLRAGRGPTRSASPRPSGAAACCTAGSHVPTRDYPAFRTRRMARAGRLFAKS